MKSETKVLVVLIILILSTGPLISIFGNARPPVENISNDSSQFEYLSGNITAQVVSVQPFISYVGASSVNNESFVRSRIDSITGIANYTLSIELSSELGGAYQYKITALPKEGYTPDEVGFKLVYKLSDFFEASSKPVRLGAVSFSQLLVVETESGRRTIENTNNLTAKVALYFWQSGGLNATLHCSRITVSELNKLLYVPEVCIDNSPTARYYLPPEEYFSLFINEDTRHMDLAVDRFAGSHFEGLLVPRANLSVDVTREKITQWLIPYFTEDELSIELQMPSPTYHLGYFKIDTVFKGSNITQRVDDVLRSFKLNASRVYNVVLVNLPESIQIGLSNVSLEVIKQGMINANLTIPDTAKTLGADVTFYLKYGEAIDIAGEATSATE